jgi:hypothetical protein
VGLALADYVLALLQHFGVCEDTVLRFCHCDCWNLVETVLVIRCWKFWLGYFWSLGGKEVRIYSNILTRIQALRCGSWDWRLQ